MLRFAHMRECGEKGARLHPLEIHVKNRDWFEANREEEARKHPNRWIAVKDGQVVAEGDHYAKLNEQVILQFGRCAAQVTYISTVYRQSKT